MLVNGNFDFEDFYDEPSAFEEQVAEFKAGLMESVKKEFLEQMEQLKKENASLQKENASLRDFRDKKEKYALELARIRRDCEEKVADAKREAEKMRFKDLLRNFSVVGYRPEPIYTERPKCDRCDEHRRIKYFSPMGRKCTEECKCARKLVHYEPVEVKMLKFFVNDDRIDIYYERFEEGRDFDFYELRAEIYEQMESRDFEKILSFCIVFLLEENCQEYCDWLNEREKEKEAQDA